MPAEKFNKDSVYRPDEFIGVAAGLLRELQTDLRCTDILLRNIEWASKLPKDSIIFWIMDEKGTLFPRHRITYDVNIVTGEAEEGYRFVDD